MGTPADWRGVIQHVPLGEPVLAPTIPGHAGRPLPEGELSLERVADTLMEELPPRSVLVGYSMGGRLALTAAVRHPDRVKRLVLVSASVGIDDESDWQERLALDRARAESIREDFQSFLEDWYRMPLFSSLATSKEDVTRIVAGRLEGDPDALARVVVELSPGNQPDYRQALRDLTFPVLLVAGALDSSYVSQNESLATEPHITARTVAGCGHAVHLEAPDILAEMIFEPGGAS